MENNSNYKISSVDGRSLVTLTHYKAANIENEYSGAELAV